MQQQVTKVLVTGGTGFIGRNTVERLRKRKDIDLYAISYKRQPFTHDGVSWINSDLRNAEHIQMLFRGMDIVIHAAATSTGSRDVIERPYIHTTDNAVMTSLVLRAAFEEAVKHVIYFGSTTIYRSCETPVTEDWWDVIRSPEPQYFASAWTKIYIEKMCEFYASLGRTKHTVLRNSNVYGPHDKFDLEKSHVLGATITKVMTAKTEYVTVWGDGQTRRDLLYIDDLVDAVEAVIEKQNKPFRVYNIGLGKMISVDGLVGKIIEHSGRKLGIAHELSAPSIKTALCLDCSLAKEELGWTTKTSLDDGIKMTIEWWKSQRQRARAAEGELC